MGLSDVLGGALERVGLARRTDSEDDASAVPSDGAVKVETTEVAPVIPVEESSAMTLAQVYAAAEVPASAYPAEKLLRLTDKLKAMDAAGMLTTINAVVDADGSWTLADPINDAKAKLGAIEAHVATIRTGVTQAEAATQTALSEQQATQEVQLTEIRRQISELQGLLGGAISRGEQEVAAIGAALTKKKDGAARELGSLSQTSSELQALVNKFNTI